MSAESQQDCDETLAKCGIHIQKALTGEIGGILFQKRANVLDFPRREFTRLHSPYRLVPEVYLSLDLFDSFCPPERHLEELREELPPGASIGTYLHALGCYCKMRSTEFSRLCAALTVPVTPHPGKETVDLILICFARIKTTAQELNLELWFELLHAVATHEHSHAARACKYDGPPEVLRAEETVAQWETYMFLLAEKQIDSIEAMKRLMPKQPRCYQIPIP